MVAAVPNTSFLEVHGFRLERFKLHPLTFEAGEAIAPSRPGDGVVFDWDALEAHRVSCDRPNRESETAPARRHSLLARTEGNGPRLVEADCEERAGHVVD